MSAEFKMDDGRYAWLCGPSEYSSPLTQGCVIEIFSTEDKQYWRYVGDSNFFVFDAYSFPTEKLARIVDSSA